MVATTHRELQTRPARNTRKAKKIAYWVSTGLVAFCMTGGFFELLNLDITNAGITRLGYPSYIIPFLGLAKILAIVAILWPGFPRLKEWAYAGIVFNMIGATVSHLALDDGPVIFVTTTTIIALTMASWSLRPPSRRLRAEP
jgi:hypothetical protein